jgi:hypothetical protein
VSYEVEYTNDFETWWSELSEDEQVSVTASVGLLADRGALLGFPHSSGIATSKHSHMRELRIQHQGEPYRVFYAFDPRRVAMLLVGGCKVGNDRFYEEMVPRADRIYDRHLEELAREKPEH